MKFSKVFPLLIAMARRKGRTEDEVDKLVDDLAKGKPCPVLSSENE